MLQAGKPRPAPPQPAPQKEVPTLKEFGPRFIEGHARAARQKASGVSSKESILRVHLYPELGKLPLDQITDERVAKLQGKLADKSRKTTNNILTTLSKLLKVAFRWKVIDRMPCTIDLLKVDNTVATFLDFEEYDHLAEAAERIARGPPPLFG